MTPHIETMVSQRKQEILRKMKGLFREDAKREANELLQEWAQLYQVEKAIAESAGASRYSDIGPAIKAIVRYLEDVGEPKHKDEIAQGVHDGGWRGGSKSSLHAIYASLGVFTHPNGKGTNSANAPLKMKGDLIGLKGWPDGMFASKD